MSRKTRKSILPPQQSNYRQKNTLPVLAYLAEDAVLHQESLTTDLFISEHTI